MLLVAGGSGTDDAPYYMIMRLPGATRAEYVLMLPMVPSQRENMIAWMAARCDPPDYGKVVVYQFSKDKQVYGPFQIEARIQQNTDISQQISLWNQMGSRVIRGHLVVVPIDHSILYVSPLYLRAASGQLPELKRVIAAYGDRVVMEETLGAALAALFKESGLARGWAAALHERERRHGRPGDARAREALAHYDRAIERLKAGDWAGSARNSMHCGRSSRRSAPAVLTIRSDLSRTGSASAQHNMQGVRAPLSCRRDLVIQRVTARTTSQDGSGLAVFHACQPQRVPGHREVAGDHRFAGSRLKFWNQPGDAQARA